MYRVTRQHLAIQLVPHMLYMASPGSDPAIKESEHDVRSLEEDENYLAGKLLLKDYLGKAPCGIEKYHQHNAGALRFHIPQLEWTGYLWLCPTPSPEIIIPAMWTVYHVTAWVKLYHSVKG